MPMMSIGRTLRAFAEREPDRVLVSDETTSLTRSQVERLSNRLARAYIELGVQTDDMVAIALPNGVDFMVAQAAAWKAGATPLLLSSALPELERRAILELARPRLVVGVEPGRDPGVISLAAGYVPDPAIDDAPLAEDRIASRRRALTSGGSTGRPKIIVSPTPALADPDAGLGAALGRPLPPEPTVLIVGPLYHAAHISSANIAMLSGTHVAIARRFDAKRTLELLDRHRAVFTVLVPTMMNRIWRLGAEERARHDLGALQGILHTAAPCPDWLKQAFIDWLGPDRVFELYGSSEDVASTMITGREWLAHRGSVGRVSAGAIKVLDAAGRELPPGEVGELYMRTPPAHARSFEYIGAEIKARGEWQTLGDLGHIDADGYLFLADRKVDLIITGGANVYPAEVEAAIEAHPAVRSSAVIGLPDEDLGARIHAIIDVADQTLDDDAMRVFLSERLLRYKIPRSFEWVREPLRNDAGKVRRSALRAARVAAAANASAHAGRTRAEGC